MAELQKLDGLPVIRGDQEEEEASAKIPSLTLKTNEQTNKQTNKKTNEQTNKQTNIQTNKQTTKQTDQEEKRRQVSYLFSSFVCETRNQQTNDQTNKPEGRGHKRKQARKLGRCDSYLQNLKTLPTDPRPTGVGARRCYRL